MKEQIREEFREAESKQRREEVKEDPWRLRYHLMPPVGWLNDPNGLCEIDGIYHIFYQYAPQNAQGSGMKGWGHYTTPDFIHYKEEEVPLFPDDESDAKGAYSGSAFKDPRSHLTHFFYTGNNKQIGDYDYIYKGRIHWTNHFTSEDGFHFSSKETLMKNSDYPDNLSCHVRDPKILMDNDRYYMVLGARTLKDQGQVNVFRSDDLKAWTPVSVISSQQPFGYMWECPDLFDLDGKRILMTCPQGVDQAGYRYENIYQNGYFFVDGSLDQDQKLSGFQELDHGFDFYAPQSFEDEKGRRILIGWMGIPDADYTNPTTERGWQHALTLPRVLHVKNGKLYQYPVEEMQALRIEGKEEKLDLKAHQEKVLPSAVFELQLNIDNKPFTLKIREDAEISYRDGLFTLSLKKSGSGRDCRHIEISGLEKLSIFSDTSSLEIFLNEGQEAMTTRVYDQIEPCSVVSSTDLSGEYYPLSGYILEERSGC